MDWYIGIDLGTSAQGTCNGWNRQNCWGGLGGVPSQLPRPGWSEQDSADWVKAMERVLAELS